MNNKIIIILIIMIASLSFVNAGNNTTTVDNPTTHTEEVKTVQALESGDSNISFSDGYRGYCIEWGEHSAEANETFYINNDVDNNIKVFFVYFYNEAQKDVIATQHMIWKFTDNKQFSKFNQTLYDKIIEKSATIQVPNSGTMQINNHTEMVFDFKNFIAEFEEYQNYFGYKIFFRNITSSQINETITNNSTTILPQLYNNTSNVLFNDSYIMEYTNNHTISTPNSEKIVISNHITGTKMEWLFGCIIIMIILCILLHKPKS